MIFVVALIVFGPKRLPELGKTLGKGMLELRKAMEGVREQMHAESEDHPYPRRGALQGREKKMREVSNQTRHTQHPGRPSWSHDGQETEGGVSAGSERGKD